MHKFTRLESTVAPLPLANIDTDQIIPARYLKITDRSGLAAGLFANWRDQPDFVLEQPAYRDARILLAGDNFGCGCSREHAAWALYDWGIRAVISTQFADIFKSNATRNGVLPVVVDAETWQALRDLGVRDPQAPVTVDLERQLLTFGERSVAFTIDPFARRCLLLGVDPLGFLLDQLPRVEAWEGEHPSPIDTIPAG